jgi:hypothetical protein
MRERTDVLGRDGYTWWVGEVEDNNDPSKLGRVRVRILGWYTGHKSKEDYIKEVPTEVLPWANVLLPTDKPQTKNTGTMSELQCGSWVLGFFLDGDEAQLPIVLGAFRGFQVEGADKRTTVADPKVAEKDAPANAKQQETPLGTTALDGASFAKTQQSSPSSPVGGQDNARGAISALEETLPGNAVTNPIKPPVEKQGIGDGVAASAGEGFETDIRRMLTEMGNMAASIGSAGDKFVSLVNGARLAGDKVLEHLGKIANYLSGAIAGVLAPLKEILAQAIATVINALVKIISSFIPMGVITAILGFLEQIFAIFCAPVPAWLGLVQAALADTANFANQIATLAVDKITSVIQSAIGEAVEGITNRILEGIQSAMNRMSGITGDIISAVNTARAMGQAASRLGETVSMIMEFDFTNLDWGSLIAFILAILGLFFKKDCGRKIKRPKAKAWFPLIGTTTCTNIDEAVQGTNYASLLKSGNPKDGSGLGGSYIDQMFTDINPYMMEVQTFLNGAKKIFDATPGKEKAIESGPGGQTNFQDSFGNQHQNVPNNSTKIIGRDKCETIKGNYVLTVEGDFYLKVMGNYHEEIVGAKNENKSNGPQSESEGSSSAPDISKAQQSESVASGSTGSNVQAANPDPDFGDTNNTASKYDLASFPVKQKERRAQYFKKIQGGGFYPVDKIPYHPDADEMGRTPWGPQLSTELKDDKEQKSGQRLEGDHNISYTGDVTIQGNKVKITGIESVNINSQIVKTEANSIEMVADGEIFQEANWITSFLNAGRLEMIALFNPFAALTGSFRVVKGTILELATDVPFPAVAPPMIVRTTVAVSQPGSIHDICIGSTSGIINSFIACPTGVITEFTPSGSIVNQVVSGMASYSVGAGFMATGCAFGPHQVYGLPLLLN